MSGLLSLVRELLGIYAPQSIAPAALFWTCTRVAFIVSAAGLIVSQRHELAKLRASKKRPDIQASDISIMTGQLSKRVTPTGTIDVAGAPVITGTAVVMAGQML